MAREENCRWIIDAFQALIGHGKDAQLIDRAKAILNRAQHSVTATSIALKIEHSIDHVLQYAWAGQCALLGDMTNQENGGFSLLGIAHQLRRAFAYLGD